MWDMAMYYSHGPNIYNKYDITATYDYFMKHLPLHLPLRNTYKSAFFQMWAECFRSKNPLGCQNTTNGVEGYHKILKKNYLLRPTISGFYLIFRSIRYS